MKKRMFKPFALLCLVVLAVSMMSVSALAADGGESAGILEKFVGPVYEPVKEFLAPVMNYLMGVVLLFTELPAWGEYAIFLGLAAIALLFLVLWIVALCKRRFFRAIARAVIFSAVIWLVTLGLYF